MPFLINLNLFYQNKINYANSDNVINHIKKSSIVRCTVFKMNSVYIPAYTNMNQHYRLLTKDLIQIIFYLSFEYPFIYNSATTEFSILRGYHHIKE